MRTGPGPAGAAAPGARAPELCARPTPTSTPAHVWPSEQRSQSPRRGVGPEVPVQADGHSSGPAVPRGAAQPRKGAPWTQATAGWGPGASATREGVEDTLLGARDGDGVERRGTGGSLPWRDACTGTRGETAAPPRREPWGSRSRLCTSHRRAAWRSQTRPRPHPTRKQPSRHDRRLLHRNSSSRLQEAPQQPAPHLILLQRTPAQPPLREVCSSRCAHWAGALLTAPAPGP